jgi:hypothetical protein
MSEKMCIEEADSTSELAMCGRSLAKEHDYHVGLDSALYDVRHGKRPCPACIRAAVAALEGAGVESAADARKRHGFAPLSEEQQEANLQANLDDLEQSGEGGK